MENNRKPSPEEYFQCRETRFWCAVSWVGAIITIITPFIIDFNIRLEVGCAVVAGGCLLCGGGALMGVATYKPPTQPRSDDEGDES